jgi:hypothetical protein
LAAGAIPGHSDSILRWKKIIMAVNRALMLRVATHVAVWLPFLAAVAGSMRFTWRVVGDGAGVASRSWSALTAQGPLLGSATQLGHGLHDPGPLEFWLLAIPVHADPVRGVLWGAALWCMAAGSVAIEAAWSVLGQIGGVLASGTVLWTVAWRPGIIIMPYWNPWFGTMFFLAALAAGWAVMSGRRWWWPVLVITASVATQAHLMFALAAAAVVLLALITGLADASRGNTGYRWAAAGLVAGIACWAAPFIQQFTGPGPGNLSALVHGQGTGQRTGLIFALKTLTASTEPPPLWLLARQQPDVARLIDARPAVFAVALLGVTAAALLLAVFQLRSRPLARLAALSLLASAAALVTFSRIPLKGDSLSRLDYLVTVMFPVGLLAWLTVGPALVLTGRLAINQLPPLAPGRAVPHGGRPEAARDWARRAARIAGAAAAPLIVLASWLGVVQRTPALLYDAPLVQAVNASFQQIDQQLPSQPMALSVVGANSHARHRLTAALGWALTSDGYQLEPSARSAGRQLPHVTVLLRGNTIAVDVTNTAASHTEGPGRAFPTDFPAAVSPPVRTPQHAHTHGI